MNLKSEMKFLAGVGVALLGGFTVMVNIGDPMKMPSIPVVSSITPIMAQNGFGENIIVSHSDYRTRNQVSNMIQEMF